MPGKAFRVEQAGAAAQIAAAELSDLGALARRSLLRRLPGERYQMHELLRQFARLLGPDGRLLIGIDQPKAVERLEAAYDDRAGISAAFALNLLTRLQRELGINITNYGPDVDAGLIRAKMPEAMILGQTPPMLVRNGTPEEIRQRVVDDFKKAGAGGGLKVATAGSLAGGTGMGRLRYYMQLVQEECRYDR